MSALSAAIWRVSATTPHQHHTLIHLQSGFEWFELFGLFRLFQLFKLLQLVLNSLSVVLGCFMLFFVQTIVRSPEVDLRCFNVFVICATLI